MGKKYIIRYEPLPPKGDLKALAAARHRVSPVLLANRLRLHDPKELARFARLAKITARQAQRLRGSKLRAELSPEEVQVVRDEWQLLIDDTGYYNHKEVTQEKLREILRSKHDLEVTRSTCSRVLQGIKKPPVVRKPRENNVPECYWANLSSQRYRL